MDTVAPGILASFEKDLRDAIGEPRYKMWLQGHTKFSIEESEILIGVPNRFYRDWLDTHYRAYIEGCVARAFGEGTTLRFRIDPELFRNHQTPANDGTASEKAIRTESVASPRPLRPSTSRFAMARFVVGPSNRVAYAAATTLVEDPRRGYSPLLLYGGNGLGKTHLLKAIEDECQRRHKALRVLAISSEEFTNSYLEGLKTHRLSTFRQRVRSADLLLVDDVQFLAGKVRTMEEFLHTLNALENRGAKVVLTSGVHPRKLERMPEELKSRLVAGMVARLDPLDRDMRRQVVLDKSISRRLELSQEVLDFLADNLRSSVNELEGAINYLEHYSETFGRRLSLEAVRTALAEIIRNSVPMIRVEEVRERVCKLFQINPRTIAVRKRNRAISHPRMLVLYLARKYTTSTYSEIGREIGGLNHSSVIAAERRIKTELSKDGELVLGDRTWKVRDAIEAFEREIGPR